MVLLIYRCFNGKKPDELYEIIDDPGADLVTKYVGELNQILCDRRFYDYYYKAIGYPLFLLAENEGKIKMEHTPVFSLIYPRVSVFLIHEYHRDGEIVSDVVLARPDIVARHVFELNSKRDPCFPDKYFYTKYEHPVFSLTENNGKIIKK